MQIYCPFARPANQDRKYFPYSGDDDRTDEQKLEDGLTQLLGSRQQARAYIREQKEKKK